MAALAWQCCAHQHLLLRSTLSFGRALVAQQRLTPIAALWHVKYDETPLRMQVRYESTMSDHTTGKLHVVETEWGLLFAEPDATSKEHFRFFRGGFSAACRIADRASAEGVCSVIHSCPAPDEGDFQGFPIRIRLPESDALSANFRAERLVSQLPSFNSWSTFHWPCTAHKVHASATKAWKLLHNSQLISGITTLGLYLNSPGCLSQFRDLLKKHIQRALVVEAGPPDLPAATTIYRLKMVSSSPLLRPSC